MILDRGLLLGMLHVLYNQIVYVSCVYPVDVSPKPCPRSKNGTNSFHRAFNESSGFVPL
jgi:hypothetical protein